MRQTPRSRRYLPSPVVRILRVIGFRYDYPRDAYILVLVGRRFGPVIRVRPR